MKYILMMTGMKAQLDWYAKWSKHELQAQVSFMHAFNKELKDSGVLVATEGLAFPDQARIVPTLFLATAPSRSRLRISISEPRVSTRYMGNTSSSKGVQI